MIVLDFELFLGVISDWHSDVGNETDSSVVLSLFLALFAVLLGSCLSQIRAPLGVDILKEFIVAGDFVARMLRMEAIASHTTITDSFGYICEIYI